MLTVFVAIDILMGDSLPNALVEICFNVNQISVGVKQNMTALLLNLCNCVTQPLRTAESGIRLLFGIIVIKPPFPPAIQ